jgi:DNA primase catalytic subunit
VHCWVCDPEARNMTNEMRTSVASYINIAGLGNEKAERLYL